MNLALFDFDGTITHCDTFTPFIKKAVPSSRMYWGGLLLLPSIIGYRIGVCSASTLRQQIVYVCLKGFSTTQFKALGETHAREFLTTVIRANALERIKWHLEVGDRVIVVSASLEVYLKPWCDALGVELICSQLQVNRESLTGKYANADCSGEEKAKRVKSLVNLDEYQKIYAYGDTKEDEALLKIADEQYFQWQKRI
ncbi:HAD family hydrolase [Psychrobacter sp. 16-MNA-CIBAN-0192]|uniref:HAD family hydrolase n=1 Tax=Psychrobacter sp. 16-MNA-CIBAN-0192 TaxID=3140448 RepID=UPI0033312547